MVAVGVALNELCPTEADWTALLDDPDVQQEIAAFATVMDEIRTQAMNGLDAGLVALERAGAQHHGRAVEAVTLLADRLGVPPDDLVSILLHA